jgi:hypothetical protein
VLWRDGNMGDHAAMEGRQARNEPAAPWDGLLRQRLPTGWNVTEGRWPVSEEFWWPCPSSVSKFRRLSGGSGEIGLHATENRGDKATSATAGDADWREALRLRSHKTPCICGMWAWQVIMRTGCMVRSAHGWSSGQGTAHDREASYRLF